jgi:predicted TIM-barrel fold metal-dependent hydrolase
MLLDCHVHLFDDAVDRARFLSALDAAGVDGCILLSLPPVSFAGPGGPSAADRLANLDRWCGGEPRLVPFFWIDPVEPDAECQVELALCSGVRGFKVIANHFFPGDPRALPVYRAIAAAGRPMLFHSGILWDGRESSRSCRPAEFESLLEVPGLRFALAHASWPWCDECLAVFGKFEHARQTRPDVPRMFIDLTPGTPPIYRENLLRSIFTIGYDIEGSLLWGSDSVVPGYDPGPVRAWFARDRGILDSLDVGQEAREGLFHRNLERFLAG